MLEKAKAIVNSTLNIGEKVIIGLSGGADSIALSYLVHSIGYAVVPIHVNFNLREDESNRDEQFVRDFCDKYLPHSQLIVHSVDTLTYAKEHGVSIEMAAREIRYRFFAQVAERESIKWILVAHHADDQIETSLLNLSRGSGCAGLAGMKVVNHNIFRPLLTTYRSEILGYLSSLGIAYITDSTNTDTTYKRNYIRHILVPALEELNPSFRKSFLENIQYIREEEEVIDRLTWKFVTEYVDEREKSILLDRITNSETNRFLFKRWTHSLGFNYSMADDMLHSCDGEKTSSFENTTSIFQIYRKKGYHINKSYYESYSIDKNEGELLINIGDTTRNMIGQKRLYISKCIGIEQLSLRHSCPKDNFQPFGMKGSKSVFRFLGERGIPEYYRSFCPVMEYEGEVIAALPFQISEKARVESLDQANLLQVRLFESPLAYILANLLGLI